jgi:hypothetical protein
MLKDKKIKYDFFIRSLSSRSLGSGGFSGRSGSGYRPDATAWAVIVFDAMGVREDLVQAGQKRLALDQMQDGRVSIASDCPQAFWPTSLAVFAWHDCPEHRTQHERALRFLLSTTGNHFKKQKESPTGHDTAIQGWPWIDDTHSWVEPTSLALLALELTGNGKHERASEARRMLLDRQLEAGGWNYGNTTVFGRQLRPMPESTGLALSALAGRVAPDRVRKSLSYLKDRIGTLRTPLSLGWGLLGLSAWGERPEGADDAVLDCLDRQKMYGQYDTQHLSLLMAAFMGKQGFVRLRRSGR